MSAYQLNLVGIAPAPALRLVEPAQLPPEGSTDEWFTLPEEYEPLHAEFGFTLDAFAAAGNNKCPRFYSKEQDALAQRPEGEHLFGNPPYSDLHRCTTWARNAALFNPLVVLILPAWTDRLWFHHNVEPFWRAGLMELRFLKGRRRYGWPGMPQGAPGKVATFPTMHVVLRGTPELRAAIREAIAKDGWAPPSEEQP